MQREELKTTISHSKEGRSFNNVLQFKVRVTGTVAGHFSQLGH